MYTADTLAWLDGWLPLAYSSGVTLLMLSRNFACYLPFKLLMWQQLVSLLILLLFCSVAVYASKYLAVAFDGNLLGGWL